MSYNKPIRRIAIVGTGASAQVGPLNISLADSMSSRSNPRLTQKLTYASMSMKPGQT
jgi:hypothetical protein